MVYNKTYKQHMLRSSYASGRFPRCWKDSVNNKEMSWSGIGISRKITTISHTSQVLEF
jgi:hypothetical protein